MQKYLRRFICMLCLIIAAGCMAHFFEKECHAEKISVSVNSKFWSKYLLKGATVSDEPVWQNTIFIGFPKGFYGLLFSSVSLTDLRSDAGKELDLVIGWSGPIGHYFDLDAGITYFNFPKLGKVPEGDQLQWQARISKTITWKTHSISPYTMVEAVIPLKNSEPKGGVYAHGGIAHNWNLTDKLTFSESASAIYDSGAFGLDNALIGQYTANVSLPLHEKFSLDLVSVIISGPLTKSHDRYFDVAVGTGFTVNFSLF